MNNNSLFSKFFESSEELVSMFLGLIIVVVAVGLVVNYFQKRKGEISLPGITDQNKLELSAQKVNTKKVDLNVNKNFEGEYVVKKGDSLWKISQSQTGSGYNWTQIAKTNKINNPGVLYEGQKLNIPKIELKVDESVKKPEVVIKPDTKYVVVKGDSLWKIAVKNYGDGYKWTKIWDANKAVIHDPGKLEVGMKLALI